MDSLITAAARALAAGDALGALKRIALRDDPPALALRRSAVMQRYSFLNSSVELNGALFAPQAMVEFCPPPGMISTGKPEPMS